MRILVASLAAVLMTSPALAQVPDEPEREREHVVRSGDTLWRLAQDYYSDPFQWPRIHRANPQRIADPHWIFPDQVLIIPGIRDGRPGLVMQPAGRPVDPAQPVERLERVERTDGPARTVFYREPPARLDPEGTTVLREPARAIVPVRPGEFHTAQFLADPSQIPAVGMVVRAVREIRPLGDLQPSAHPTDQLYIRYHAEARPAVDDRLVVVAVGRRIHDAGLAIHALEPRAMVRVVQLMPGDILLAQIEEQFGSVRGDQFVVRSPLFPDFRAEAALPLDGPPDLQGRILGFVHDQALYGPPARAFIDRGRQHGVHEGDIFEAYLPPRTERVPGLAEFQETLEHLPAESIALLRVIRVQDATATVVVDQVTTPRLDDGIGVQRVRKMP